MRAYWEEATDIGQPDELRRLSAEVGLDESDVAGVLAGDGFRDVVHASTQQAYSIGITGIPGFILGRRARVLGAHPRETFEQVLAQLGHT
jgi:predicted DsbA family dithiol-disulfide isomerase